MSTRSLNKVMLIGNLTRDVELKYTPSGTAVATFGLATNRGWTTDSGERNEDTQFHRIVAWSKLAEICGQLLFKGRKVFIEGRLQTRKWTGQDGQQREMTEIVAENMMILDNRNRDGVTGPAMEEETVAIEEPETELPVEEHQEEETKEEKKKEKKTETKKEEEKKEEGEGEVNIDEIPF